VTGPGDLWPPTEFAPHAVVSVCIGPVDPSTVVGSCSTVPSTPTRESLAVTVRVCSIFRGAEHFVEQRRLILGSSSTPSKMDQVLSSNCTVKLNGGEHAQVHLWKFVPVTELHLCPTPDSRIELIGDTFRPLQPLAQLRGHRNVARGWRARVRHRVRRCSNHRGLNVPNVHVLKAREVEQILKNLGFERVRQPGSHKQYRHVDGRATTVPSRWPRHSPILPRQIARDIGKTVEELLQRR